MDMKQAMLERHMVRKYTDKAISGKESKVSISCDNGIFTGVDTGLVKYHFELGAGKDNFAWE